MQPAPENQCDAMDNLRYTLNFIKEGNQSHRWNDHNEMKLAKLKSLIAKYCKVCKLYPCEVCKLCIFLYNVRTLLLLA